MAQQILDFLGYFFLVNPNVLGILLAWLVALVFGAIWLACYRPPLIAKPWLWAVLGGGAIIAPIAITVASFPLKFGVSWVYDSFLSQETVTKWAVLLVNIPSIYLFGLVREGFKLVPVVVYWWRKGKNIEPKLGLAAGAVSGAGFGILEAQWTLNYAFASGWSWLKVQLEGPMALAVFWESFFLICFNIATCALAGWGLARGWIWQCYLLAAFAYLVMNYNTVLLGSGLISPPQVEFIIAAWALIVTGVVLWLREKKSEA
jgi:hypothetical protein